MHRKSYIPPIPQTISNCSQLTTQCIRPVLASGTSYYTAHNDKNQLTCTPGTAYINYTIDVDFQITSNYGRSPAFGTKLASQIY